MRMEIIGLSLVILMVIGIVAVYKIIKKSKNLETETHKTRIQKGKNILK
jgi:hypothetical protein